jgi:hypothetical protein
MALLFGQRWVYEVGNSVVAVDNAYTVLGWSKERLLVNDEEVQSATAYWNLSRSFSEPWLTRVGEEDLEVALTVGFVSLRCAVRLGGDLLASSDIQKAFWRGDKHSWPSADIWKSTRRP